MTLALYGKSRRRQASLIAIAVLATLIAVVASIYAGRVLEAQAASVTPTAESGNPTCAGLGFDNEFKVDVSVDIEDNDLDDLEGTWSPGDPGTTTVGTPLPGSIVISNVEDSSGTVIFDWATQLPVLYIDAVIVKQGSGALVFDYTPDGSNGDTDLYPPAPTGGISHVTFCWNDKTLTVTKLDENGVNPQDWQIEVTIDGVLTEAPETVTVAIKGGVPIAIDESWIGGGAATHEFEDWLCYDIIDGQRGDPFGQNFPFPFSNPGLGPVDTDIECDVINAVPDDQVVVHVDKIVCEPNGAFPVDLARPITTSTASDYVDLHPGCHLASGWDFEWQFDNQGWTDFDNPTDGNGRTSQALSSSNVSTIKIREETQVSHHFVQLSCHNDIGGETDNEDHITGFAGGGNYYCVAFNVVKLVNLTLIKSTENNAVPGQFDLEIRDWPADNLIIAGDGTGTTTSEVAVGQTYHIIELDEPGWVLANVQCTAGSLQDNDAAGARFLDIPANQTEDITCTFFNRPWTAWVNVTKIVTNEDGGATEFDFSISDPANPFTLTNGQNSGDIPIAQGDQVVTEAPEPGYTTLGWARIFAGNQCPAEMPTDNSAPVINFGTDNTYEVNVPFNNTYVVCFYNEQVPEFTVNTYKVVCQSESDLPNWGDADLGNDNYMATPGSIIAGTAAAFVAASGGRCELVTDWQFAIADDPGAILNPGDNNTSPGTGFTAFSGSVNVPSTGDQYRIREVFQDGYVEFSETVAPTPLDDVSAEFYCNDDVANYDNYEWVRPTDNDGSGQSYCVAFNAHEPVEVTFTKYICPSYGDVPRNYTGAVAHPGLPVGSLGASQLVAGEAVHHGIVDPDCDLATDPWTFELGSSLGASDLGTVATVNGQAVHELTPDQLNQALTDKLWVSEVEQDPPYAFGNLKCFKDHVNQDNDDFIAFDNEFPATEVHCIAFNVEATTIWIAKDDGTHEEPGDPIAGATFLLERLDPNNGDATLASWCVTDNQGAPNAVAACAAATAIGDGNGGDGQIQVSPLPVGKYRVTEVEGPANHDPDTCGGVRTFTLENKFGWSLTQETGACQLHAEAFHNPPSLGTVVLVKYDNIGGPDTWNFAANDDQIGGGTPQLVLPDNFTGVTVSNSDSWDVTPGQYSISEDEGEGICPSTGAQTGDYETLVLVSDQPIGANELVTHGTTTGFFQVNAGETVFVAFGNRDCSEVLSAANIIVRKYVDHDGDGVADVLANGWEITITGTGGAAAGFGPVTLTTGDSGLGTAAFLGVPDGTYDIEETTKATHTPLGSDWLINGPPNGSNTSGAIQLTDIPVNLNEELNVDFYNQPKGRIIVVKTVTDNVGNVGVDGWRFDLTGCGVASTKFTDGTGTAVFENLLPCPNYTVTEHGANEDGFTVSPSAAQFVNLGPAEEEAVTFHNVRNPETTPGITTTPTTPTTPPDTATPTNTPTTPDDTTTPDTTTPDPTETEDTAGEITPGTEATPIAPDSGSGLAGNSTGASIMLLLMGLAAITMGSGFLALGRKRS